MSVAVLMYHGLGNSADPEGGKYAVSPLLFSKHIAALIEAKIPVVSSQRASPFTPAAAITFDDGEVSVLDAAPILAAAGLSATVFVTTGFLGREGYLSREHLKELSRAGFLIGAHGESHRFWTELSAGELERELGAPRRFLEDLLGGPVSMASAPGGRVDQRCRATAARVGYTRLFTSRPGLAQPWSDPLDLPRITMYRDTTPARLVALARGALWPSLALKGRDMALRAVRHLVGEAKYRQARAFLSRAGEVFSWRF